MILRRRKRAGGGAGIERWLGPLAPAVGFAQLGSGAVLSGRLQGSGLLIVHGTCRGRIDLTGELLVASDGRLAEAQVRAQRLRVEGVATGRFRIEGPLEVAAGASLDGTIEAQSIQTAPDSKVSGGLRIAVSRK